MYDVQSLLTKEKLAALLTTACITRSYEVETTKTIVEMWKKLRDHMSVEGPLDGITQILVSGRIMDLERDIKKPEDLDDIVKSIKVRVDKTPVKTVGFREVSCAFLTAACTSHSHEVETTKSIVEFWEALCKTVQFNDAKGLVASILATGRIMDIRVDIKSPAMINDIVKSIVAELDKAAVADYTEKEISCAFLSAAYIEISPKVERYRDMVNGWSQVRVEFKPEDPRDHTAAIMFAGRIKDADSILIMKATPMMDEIKKLRTEM